MTLNLQYNNSQKIICGDCHIEMGKMESNSIDFIVTDPPYGLNFMNKSWDKAVPNIDIWKEAYRVLKPGSMLAAFGGSRTHHHLMIALEQVGFEIRDVIMWVYSQGFPKSHNKFGLEGYGTALKPAYEPIILAMKPINRTYAQNVQEWGIGGINIDGCRIPYLTGQQENAVQGSRWPSNTILDEEAAKMLDQQSNNNASRFFYCAKASASERNKGLEELPKYIPSKIGKEKRITVGGSKDIALAHQNHHVTVKPISLMEYIIKLLAPPNNPILLDPFCGSGSTLLAARNLGINAIGIEINEEYCEIARKRIENG